MRKIEVEARAKINLTLDVVSKRPDGYHDVEMLMQSIDLADHITIELDAPGEISIETDDRDLPTGEENLAYKAARLMVDEFSLDAGVKITINKDIPLAAGLAGGSADAAAVILGMDRLFELGNSNSLLSELGVKIGADVPFCIHGGTALARGIGEILTPLKAAPSFPILLVKPPYNISTREIYSALDLESINQRPETLAMIRSIEDQDVEGISQKLCNVMEKVTFKLCPELMDLKSRLRELGSMGSLMSGSGPTIFGIFESQKDAQRAAEALNLKHCWVRVASVV